MNGFSEKTVEFMWNIRFNNNKSWFEAHRDEYAAYLERPMRALAEEVHAAFSARCGQNGLRLHISRIYRDARRLHGGGPYKDHLWFTLRSGAEDWTGRPVFWFELAPEKWSFGLGYYKAAPLTMEKLRARIDGDPGPLLRLDRELAGQSEFVLEGEDYAKPKCSPGKPLAVWYNKKTFSLIHEENTGEAVFSPALALRLTEGFAFLAPFYGYFDSLDADPAPDKFKS